MKRKKAFEVAKFGGIDELGEAKLNGHSHNVQSIETQSKTTLEQDPGEGREAIIRRFTFGMNPEAFQSGTPTKQELFNAHIKGIEVMLWRDGMALMTEVEPRLVVNKELMQYSIFVGARPARGHILHERPQTLRELAHGN